MFEQHVDTCNVLLIWYCVSYRLKKNFPRTLRSAELHTLVSALTALTHNTVGCGVLVKIWSILFEIIVKTEVSDSVEQ